MWAQHSGGEPCSFGALCLDGHLEESFLEVTWLQMRVLKLFTSTTNQADPYNVRIFWWAKKSFSSVVIQSLSHVQLFATPWTVVHQASLSCTISQIYSNSCLLSQWCYPTISSSATPFSFCLQSFPASLFTVTQASVLSLNPYLGHYEAGILVPIKQMNKLRLREAQQYSCSHITITLNEWNWILDYVLQSSSSQVAVIPAPRGHRARSGDVFCCHNCSWHVVSRGPDAAKHPIGQWRMTQP